MIFFGLETSCDETAAALIEISENGVHPRKVSVLAQVVISQDHKATGGVMPQAAARQHMVHIDQVVRDTFDKAQLSPKDISGIGVTAGPGLVAGLLVGIHYAKALALGAQVPLWPVHHLHGHSLVVRMNDDLPFPFLLLLISGGHCLLAKVEGAGFGQYQILGHTYDDAAGECLDKVARALGGPYPGGPWLEQWALKGNPFKVPLPVPLQKEISLNFSFSGLKTAALQWIEKNQHHDSSLGFFLSDEQKADMAASLQRVIAETLCMRLQYALGQTKLNRVVVSGGVASNLYFREKFEGVCQAHQASFFAPTPSLCTDNGIMIAWATFEYHQKGIPPSLDFSAYPRWPI